MWIFFPQKRENILWTLFDAKLSSNPSFRLNQTKIPEVWQPEKQRKGCLGYMHLRLIQTTTQRDPPTRVVPRSLQVLIYRHLQTTVWANKDDHQTENHHITRLQKRLQFSSSYKASSELSGVCFKLRLYWCFLWRSFTSSTVWKTYTRHPQACDKFIKTKGNETNPYMKQVQQEIWQQLTKMTPNNDQWEIPRMIIKCYESWTRMEKRKHTNNLVLTS